MILGSTLRRSLVGALVSVVSMGTVLAGTAQARTFDLTWSEIANDCRGTGSGTQPDRCKFFPESRREWIGGLHKVSDTYWNCSPHELSWTRTWSDTTGSTDNVGGSVTLSAKLFDVVNASVTATYGHSWSRQSTVSDSLGIKIGPHEMAWIERGTAMVTVTGKLKAEYPKPVPVASDHGHYYWYAPGYQVTGPAPDNGGTVVVRNRAMTPQEIRQQCG